MNALRLTLFLSGVAASGCLLPRLYMIDLLAGALLSSGLLLMAAGFFIPKRGAEDREPEKPIIEPGAYDEQFR